MAFEIENKLRHDIFYWLHIVLFIFVSLESNTALAASHNLIIPFGAEWRYHASKTAPSKDWLRTNFVDDNWKLGATGIGYGDGDDATTLKNMRGQFSNVYIRHSFDITTKPEELYLYVRYDDAFSAYLNGKEVVKAGYDGNAPRSHEAKQFEEFKIAPKYLTLGKNVLAIQGENVNINSSDFSLSPVLSSKPINFDIVSRSLASRELNRLRERLLTQSSYLYLTNRDAIGALDDLLHNLPDKMNRTALLRVMKRLVAMIGDGHAKVSAREFEYRGAQYLPFSFAKSNEGIIAVDARQKKLVNKRYPFVIAIDDIPIEKWLSQAGLYVSRASEQLNHRRALREARRLDLLRRDFKLPQSNTSTVTFANNADEIIRSTLPLSDRRPRTARVSIGKSRLLDNNVGYMVIPKMDNKLIPKLLEQMDSFKNTEALIIDVRNNGGGRYGILQALAGYFLPPGSPPVLVNIAAYRLAPYFDEDHLASRPTFRENYKGWLPIEREVIHAGINDFKPLWTPPKNEFSEWHFMLLNRPSDNAPRFSYFGKPVIVLSNAGSFSATDGFLAAFSDFPNVTIMGQPSSGGSGRTRRFTLFEIGAEVALSSMASFRPNGKTFDGYGVEVDILVEPRIEDFISSSDYLLKTAQSYIEEIK